MATNAQSAWENAELRCYEYLVAVLESEEGVTAHLGELPITITDDSEAEMWMFKIDGGGELLQINAAQRPRCCWEMTAAFNGIFTERDRAQRVAGKVMDSLPAKTGNVPTGYPGLTGVQKFDLAGNPTLDRSLIHMKTSTEQGGEIRVWLLTIPLIVAFNNTTI